MPDARSGSRSADLFSTWGRKDGYKPRSRLLLRVVTRPFRSRNRSVAPDWSSVAPGFHSSSSNYFKSFHIIHSYYYFIVLVHTIVSYYYLAESVALVYYIRRSTCYLHSILSSKADSSVLLLRHQLMRFKRFGSTITECSPGGHCLIHLLQSVLVIFAIKLNPRKFDLIWIRFD